MFLRQFRIALCLVCISTELLAEGKPQLIITYSSHNAPPIAIVTESSGIGNITGGIIYDIGQELSARVGATAIYKFIPRKRQVAALINGDVHVYCEWNPVWTTQADKVFWSEPLYSSSDNFMVRSDRAVPLTSMDDLNGLVVGTIRGFSYSPEFTAAVKQGRVQRVDVNSNAQNIDMLALKRVDAIIIEKSIAGYLLKGRNDADLLRLEPLVDDVKGRYCAFSPKSPVSATALIQAAAAMKADGTVDEILQRYY